MFHAGVVAPSSPFLLQLLTPPEDGVGRPPWTGLSAYVSMIEGLPRPPTACEAWCKAWGLPNTSLWPWNALLLSCLPIVSAPWEVAELASLELLMPRGRPYLAAGKSPVLCGLTIPVLLLSPPIALANLLGCTVWALRLNDDMHCST